MAAIREQTTIEIPWSPSDLLRALGLTLLVTIAGVLFLVVIRPAVQGSTRLEGLVVLGTTNAIQGGMIAAIWLFALRGPRATWRQLGFRPAPAPLLLSTALLALVAAFGILAVYSLLVQALGLHDLQPTSLPPLLTGDPVTLAALVALAVVFAPLVEESFFRGFAFTALQRRWGTWNAALASSALFGVAHLSPGLIVPTALLGLLFVYTYRRTGSLWGPILVHAGFNALNTLPLIFAS